MKTFVIFTSIGWILSGGIPARAAQNSRPSPPPQIIAPLGADNYEPGPVVSTPELQPVPPGPEPMPKAVSFKLKPTNTAPELGSGSAEIKSKVLTLHLSGIGTGRYEVEALKGPGEERLRLGTVTIIDPTLSPDRQANDNKKEASAGPEQVRTVTDAQLSLPGELSPQSIQRLELRDHVGNVILAGKAEPVPPPVTANP
jgi:hypothetical protein